MKRTSTRATSAVLVGALSASLIACSAEVGSVDDDAVLPSRGDYPVTWGECDPERQEQGNLADGVQCGTMTLPVDWSRPEGELFTTRVYRKAAKGAARGTILNFPSGPGETADVGFTMYPEAEGFDVIGIDPRGVASTARVDCDTRAILKAPSVPPLTRDEFETGRGERESVARSCATRPNSLIRHLDAYSYAKDAEAFRAAVGVDRVVVTAFSYGTLQAARYLELYGDRAGGALLQGVMSPGESLADFQAVAARGSQRLFDEFAQWCATAAECGLPRRDAAAALAEATRNAEDGRLPGKTLMAKKWDAAGVIQAFEMAAQDGDFAAGANVLARLAAGRNPAPPDPEEGGPAPAGSIPFPDRIVCADFDLGIRDLRTAQDVFGRAAAGNSDVPFSPNSAQYSVICSGAPVPDGRAAAPFIARGTAPILLLSNRIDVATPKEWADKVAAALGDRAQSVVGDGIGHGGVARDPAAAAEVRAYLARI